MTVPGLVDGGVGLELRHQVRAEGVALQFATGAPASADPAPVPGVVGVGRAQPLCEVAPWGGGQGAVWAISRRLRTVS
ncbi:hypothetical protein [Streptomyces sp. NBC_01462]|uniref:hypothetical protein n=1 Tax=Streptomyces sp. NBC_01462 TaxID=2903876 RepID=UPI002E327B63|nr:hypothetical protein [Streptomyces sp. NBC_01462]